MALLPLMLSAMHCCAACRDKAARNLQCLQPPHCSLSGSSTSLHGAWLVTSRLPLAHGPPGSVPGPGKLYFCDLNVPFVRSVCGLCKLLWTPLQIPVRVPGMQITQNGLNAAGVQCQALGGAPLLEKIFA